MQGKLIGGCRLNRTVFRQLARICPALSLGALQILIAAACLYRNVSAAPRVSDAAQEAAKSSVPHSTPTQPDARPLCQATGAEEIAIACDYTPMPVNYAEAADKTQIALDRAELSFKTTDDNWMRLELRFTKLDSIPLSEAWRVYIAIDDDSGHNLIRRPLPSVNLASLAPGKSVDFKERLMFPALRPGHYQIKLWIPSGDPKFKFNSAHNLLVSSVGVADQKSGLNTIATFSVTH